MERKIKYIVVDVDGTLTDAGIYYDSHGNEMKKFCTRDGVGFLAARHLGIKLVVITGRECDATRRRMDEMKIDFLFQNVHDKKRFLKGFLEDNGIKPEEIAYIGDDVNDLPAMGLAGFVGCPADSCREVKERADYVSTVKGGQGAFRDVMEHILRENGEWFDAISNVYERAGV